MKPIDVTRAAVLSAAIVMLACATAAEPPGAAPAPRSFVGNGQTLGSGSSWYIGLADLNGDGAPDAYFEGAVWLNDGRGRFTRTDQSFGPPARPAAFGDFNGDGRIDVVCDGALRLNDGHLRFSAPKPLSSDVAMLALWPLDVNGDGAVDLIVADQQQDTLLLNDGQGGFTDTHRRLGGWAQCSYAVADLNGDGRRDIYVAIPHSPPPAMKRTPDRIWVAGSDEGFTEWTHDIPAGEHRGVVLADFDRNGTIDVLVGGPRGGALYLHDGAGRIHASGQTLGRGGCTAADFNRDGALDLFCNDGKPTDHGKPNTVWLNDGAGRFVDTGLRLGNANSVAVAIADLDGDGAPDVFVANVKNVLTNDGEGSNEVWLNRAVAAQRPLSHE